jgi:hypothetical protein
MASELPTLPDDLSRALARLVDALQKNNIAYALVGGLAAGYHSRPRFTRDIDLVLHVPQIVLPRLLETLQKDGFEFDLITTMREWNQDHMTAISFRAVRVDWLKPVLPLFQHVIDTGEVKEMFGQRVRIATAESVILTKLVAYRRQDQLDIEDLLAANRGRLDLDFIRREWSTVADAGDQRTESFEAMLNEFYFEKPSANHEK